MKKKKNKKSFSCCDDIPIFHSECCDGSIGLTCSKHTLTTLIGGICPKCDYERIQAWISRDHISDEKVFMHPEIKEMMKKEKEQREKYGTEFIVSSNSNSPIRKMLPGYSQMILRQLTVYLN